MARIPFNMPEAAIAGTTGVKIAATVFKIRLPNEFFFCRCFGRKLLSQQRF